MSTELKKIKIEYSKVLKEYLGKSESEEIINQVFSGYSFSNVGNEENFNFADSFKVRSMIDMIITSTEKKLTSKNHLLLLLNLAKLSLSRGELFLSSDIYSQVLYRTTSKEKLQGEAAKALNGLGEIASLQAKWNESFSYVRKAKKIYEKSNDIKGIASCENLLGTFYAEKGVLDSARDLFESGLARLK